MNIIPMFSNIDDQIIKNLVQMSVMKISTHMNLAHYSKDVVGSYLQAAASELHGVSFERKGK